MTILKPKKIVITGGFGFIGKLLTNHFKSLGVQVIVIDHPNVTIPNGFENVEIIRADLTDYEAVKKIKVKNVDAILHLAGQSSGPRSFFIPERDIQLNIIGTLNTIKFCINNQISRMLFASSFVVYGDLQKSMNSAIIENSFCKPNSVYGSSKLSCENLLRVYAEPNGINWNSLRMFNVYGPGQDITKPDQGLVGIFLNMLLNSNIVDVKGSLERYRDLVFIDDVIYAWECVLFSGARNLALNIGSGQKTSFLTLINKIAEILEKKDKLVINQIDKTPGDIQGCYADLSLIKEITKYYPRNDLESGLRKMISHYK